MRLNLYKFVNYNKRRIKQQLLTVALLYAIMQCYALYINTFHLFMGMPPLCPICVAVDNYANAAANTLTTNMETAFAPYCETGQYRFLPHNQFSHYTPRAPPTSIS